MSRKMKLTGPESQTEFSIMKALLEHIDDARSVGINVKGIAFVLMGNSEDGSVAYRACRHISSDFAPDQTVEAHLLAAAKCMEPNE